MYLIVDRSRGGGAARRRRERERRKRLEVFSSSSCFFFLLLLDEASHSGAPSPNLLLLSGRERPRAHFSLTRALLITMSAAVDTLIGRVKRDVVVGAASAAAATDATDAALLRSALGRFAVTKHSWRGRYRRLLAVTPAAIVTQHPDTLAVTNVWRYSLATSSSSSSNGGRSNASANANATTSIDLFDDAGDVEAVSVGKAAPPGCETGDLELTLSVRSDSKVKKEEKRKGRGWKREERDAMQARKDADDAFLVLSLTLNLSTSPCASPPPPPPRQTTQSTTPPPPIVKVQAGQTDVPPALGAPLDAPRGAEGPRRRRDGPRRRALPARAKVPGPRAALPRGRAQEQ